MDVQFLHLSSFRDIFTSYSYLDGRRLGYFREDVVQAAVVADGQVAEVMVGVADDGHGSIWKARRSALGSADQVTKGRRNL